MNILIIDDERTLNSVDRSVAYLDNIFYARTLMQARTYFYGATLWDQVYLDHDLGNENVREFTREIEEDAHNGILYDVRTFIIHSSNPLGREEMYQALHKFYNVEFARVEDLI